MQEELRLSRLLFEARELIAALTERTDAGPDRLAQQVLDEIDAYRSERGWPASGYGGD